MRATWKTLPVRTHLCRSRSLASNFFGLSRRRALCPEEVVEGVVSLGGRCIHTRGIDSYVSSSREKNLAGVDLATMTSSRSLEISQTCRQLQNGAFTVSTFSAPWSSESRVDRSSEGILYTSSGWWMIVEERGLLSSISMNRNIAECMLNDAHSPQKSPDMWEARWIDLILNGWRRNARRMKDGTQTRRMKNLKTKWKLQG